MKNQLRRTYYKPLTNLLQPTTDARATAAPSAHAAVRVDWMRWREDARAACGLRGAGFEEGAAAPGGAAAGEGGGISPGSGLPAPRAAMGLFLPAKKAQAPEPS